MRERIAVAAVAVGVSVGLVACGEAPAGPKVIAKAGAGATLVGAVDGRVYWVRAGTLSWWGGAAGSVALDDGGWASRDTVLVDASGVYVAHHDLLDRIGVGDAGWRRVAGEHPAGVVRQGDCVYVVDVAVECNGRGAMLGWPIVEGATCPRVDAPANGLQPIELAADVRSFYWANTACASRGAEDGVRSVERSTGQVARLAPDEVAPAELQATSRGVYWRTAIGIRQAKPGDPQGPRTIVPGAIGSFAVDGRGVVYAQDDGVYATAEDGGAPTRIAAVAGARDVVIDARYAYWLTADGEVIRAARPAVPR